jgi:predicted nuclease with TOPRIM domain
VNDETPGIDNTSAKALALLVLDLSEENETLRTLAERLRWENSLLVDKVHKRADELESLRGGISRLLDARNQPPTAR